MLILTRKKSECIVIGEGENKVTVMVVGISGDRVRLGLTANKSIPIHREEVWAEIRAEGAAAKDDRSPGAAVTEVP